MSLLKTRVRTLKFRKANFHLFKELVDGTSWETALGDKRDEQNWQLSEDIFLRAREHSNPMCKKSGIRKDMAQLEVNLARDAKNNKDLPVLINKTA